MIRLLGTTVRFARSILRACNLGRRVEAIGRFTGRIPFRDDSHRHHEIALPFTLDLGHSAMQTTRFWVARLR